MRCAEVFRVKAYCPIEDTYVRLMMTHEAVFIAKCVRATVLSRGLVRTETMGVLADS